MPTSDAGRQGRNRGTSTEFEWFTDTSTETAMPAANLDKLFHNGFRDALYAEKKGLRPAEVFPLRLSRSQSKETVWPSLRSRSPA